MIKIGIVGMPNVGKSSFFKLITKLNVVIENFAFSTIDPNIAVVNYCDDNLTKLQPLYAAKKIIYEQAMFYDIAGLVSGASAGVGLGNSFLACIQEVDLICHIVKCFSSGGCQKANQNDIIDNYQIINLELMLHDTKILESNLRLCTKKATTTPTKENLWTVEVLQKTRALLQKNIYLYSVLPLFSIGEMTVLKRFGFLSLKPCVVLANVSEDDFSTFQNMDNWNEFKEVIHNCKIELRALPIKFLLELTELESQAERDFFLTDYKNFLSLLRIDNLIRLFFTTLGLSFFFTCGKKEVRAWSFSVKNTNIKKSVGKIHSSFCDNFIMANVISYRDVFANEDSPLQNIYDNFEKCVNKKYVLQYGDIVNILLRN